MHELSIAEAALDIVRQSVPAGAELKVVHLRAGPLRGIEPEAMQWAWSAATRDSEFDGAELRIEILPWTLRCADCGRTFIGDDMFAPCECGSETTGPDGGDELLIVSLEVEEPIVEPV